MPMKLLRRPQWRRVLGGLGWLHHGGCVCAGRGWGADLPPPISSHADVAQSPWSTRCWGTHAGRWLLAQEKKSRGPSQQSPLSFPHAQQGVGAGADHEGAP